MHGETVKFVKKGFVVFAKLLCYWPIDTVYHARRLASLNKCLSACPSHCVQIASIQWKFQSWTDTYYGNVIGPIFLFYLLMEKCLFLKLRPEINENYD
jgi:hypothetical protein